MIISSPAPAFTLISAFVKPPATAIRPKSKLSFPAPESIVRVATVALVIAPVVIVSTPAPPLIVRPSAATFKPEATVKAPIVIPAVEAEASIVETPRPSVALAEVLPNPVAKFTVKSLSPVITNDFAASASKSIMFLVVVAKPVELTITVSIPSIVTKPASTLPAAAATANHRSCSRSGCAGQGQVSLQRGFALQH